MLVETVLFDWSYLGLAKSGGLFQMSCGSGVYPVKSEKSHQMLRQIELYPKKYGFRYGSKLLFDSKIVF